MRVEILDWIFDGYDVVVLLFINQVNDRGLGGTLSRTGWTSHQDQTVSQFGNLRQLVRKTQRLDRGNVGGNHAHDNGIDTALLKDIDAKARARRERVAEVSSTSARQSLGGI